MEHSRHLAIKSGLFSPPKITKKVSSMHLAPKSVTARSRVNVRLIIAANTLILLQYHGAQDNLKST
jgi:hypothetical protein